MKNEPPKYIYVDSGPCELTVPFWLGLSLVAGALWFLDAINNSPFHF